MPNGRDLIGLPVVVGPKLKRAGQVLEVLVRNDGSGICGLVLSEGGWLLPRRVLDWQAVRAVGPTHVLADERYLSDETAAICCRDLMGKPVLTGDGEDLGAMDDFQFQPDGRITALQLSRGFVDDLLNGKSLVPLDGPVRAGEAAILLEEPGDLSGGALG